MYTITVDFRNEPFEIYSFITVEKNGIKIRYGYPYYNKSIKELIDDFEKTIADAKNNGLIIFSAEKSGE